MCGRFTLHTPASKIMDRFGLATLDLTHKPSYNIAPTQQVLAIIARECGHTGKSMRWGLIPPWQKQNTAGSPLINARLETLSEKPTFRRLVNDKRCLIIADGFFEWQQMGSIKIPTYITLSDKQPFAFAGLWDDSFEDSCTIITRSASPELQKIHHRMPFILNPETEKIWLSSLPFRQIKDSLFEQETIAFNHYPVSTFVNSTKNNEPECISPSDYFN